MIHTIMTALIITFSLLFPLMIATLIFNFKRKNGYSIDYYEKDETHK